MEEHRLDTTIVKRQTLYREDLCSESKIMQVYKVSTEPYPEQILSRLKMERQDGSELGFNHIN